MRTDQIIRAWKDEHYRLNLSASDQAAIPENPAGTIELQDDDLGDVAGGSTWPCLTVAVSAVIHCVDSILHGTCSGFSVGCC